MSDSKFITSSKVEYLPGAWYVVKSFIEERGLVRQHIDSYNEFVERGLQQVIDSLGEVTIEAPDGTYTVRFGRVTVGEPEFVDYEGQRVKLLPSEARLRNLTYAAPIRADVYLYRGNELLVTKTMHIGDLPIMVKSKVCPLSTMSRDELISVGEDPDDPGGYFIINGSERVIVSLEDIAPNHILVDYEPRTAIPTYVAKVISSRGVIRTQTVVRLKGNKVHVTIPWIPTRIPFVIVMRALGFNDKEIADAVVQGNEDWLRYIEGSFEDAEKIETVDDAILYIGNRAVYGMPAAFRKNRAAYIIDKYLLPHMGMDESARRAKGLFLAEMVNRLIELKLGYRKPDDKDHYANKRLRLAGHLLMQLYYTAFNKLLRDMKYQLQRAKNVTMALDLSIRSSIVTNTVVRALATGNWTRRTTGVTQLLNRTNFLATISHLRRLQSPLSRTQPNFEARELHATHFGRICLNETPEGSNAGLVKNLALSAVISRGAPEDPIEEQLLMSYNVVGLLEADENLKRKGAKVFLNGKLIGYHPDGKWLVEELRNLRRHGLLQEDVSIVYVPPLYDTDNPEVYINTDPGRLMRPLVIVKDGKPALTEKEIEAVKNGIYSWSDLLMQSVVEYLDAAEEENALVALTPKELTKEHTHLELAPYLILGATAGIIPYAEYNQSPRNSYEAAMAKQALGIPYTNLHLRVDSRAHLLHYPQKPLVQTRVTDALGLNDRPIGQNLVVAVLPYESYNMEDAIVISKSAVDRGLGRSTFIITYTAETRKYIGGAYDVFERPSEDVRGYSGEQVYRKLDADGVVAPGTEVVKGEAIIGRTSPPRFMEEFKKAPLYAEAARRDSSILLAQSEGVVDEVFITTGAEGERIVHVRVRENRIPEIGDKFATRHGQKGVIGILVSQEDLPYTKDGIVPDLIINPHAFPSRMTVGQFVESLAGKVAALSGRFVDGTPFVGVKPEELEEMLIKLGFRPNGREVMYDGRTGRRLVADVFIGVTYVQKLHHMVADKIHARARGQVQMLTRQPTEGRSRGGGLRIGEMERDCIVAYGASAVLLDRMLESSDKTTIFVCKKCGLEGYFDARQRKPVCRICGEDGVVVPIEVSYAFKLLLDELKSLCIEPKLVLKEGM